jgi:hypothetical protein
MRLKILTVRYGWNERDEKKTHLGATCACCFHFHSGKRNKSVSHTGPNLAEAVRHFGEWLLD